MSDRWTRALIGSAGILAVLAVVLMPRLAPRWDALMRGRDANTPGESLAAALGAERYFEARLSGGFQFGPRRGHARGTGDLSAANVRLIAAAAERQTAVRREEGPHTLRAWGAAQLLLGDADGAVKTLTQAMALDPLVEGLASDLAAALHVRHTASSRAEDLPRALDLLGRALAQSPHQPEALYNKALVLEDLGLRDGARAAWRAYLDADTRSGWATVAAARLHALTSNDAGDLQLASALRRVPGAADAGGTPERAREFLERYVFTGASAAARASDADVREAARRLRDIQGDSMLLDTLEMLSGTSDARASTRLAEGLTCYATVVALWRAAEFAAMGSRAAQCLPALRASGSAYAGWLAVFAARGASNRGDFAASDRYANMVLDGPEFARYPIVRAWANLQRGGVAFLGGAYFRSVAALQASVSGFEQASEFEHAAGAAETLGAAYAEMGDAQNSWKSYERALRWLEVESSSLRWYATRTGVALAALKSGYPRTAETILRLNLPAAERARGASRLAETHRYLAQVYAQLGMKDEAVTHLDLAASHLREVPDATLADRLNAEVALERASEATSDPAEALEHITDAERRFRSLSVGPRAVQIATVKMNALVALGRIEEARDLGIEALRMLAGLEAGAPDRRSRNRIRGTASELLGQLVRIRVSGGDPEGAFEYRERMHGSALGAAAVPLPDLASQVAGDAAVLVYFAAPNELYRWSLTGSGAEFHRTPIERQALERLVNETRAGPGGRRSAAALADLLFADLPQPVREARLWGVVLDPSIADVPMAVLPESGGQPVAMRHQIAVASSVAAFLTAQKRGALSPGPVRDASVIAAPDNDAYGLPALPGSRAEGAKVAAIYGVDPLLGAAATVEGLSRSLASHQVIHLAGHAVADPVVPTRSHLVLTPSQRSPLGLLAEDEIEQLPAAADVVVLAACSSGGAASRLGEGLASLGGAFAAAGVKAVVATLWDVDDAAVTDVFVRLHQGLKSGLGVADALQRAQRQGLERGEDFRSWAGLVVFVG